MQPFSYIRGDGKAPTGFFGLGVPFFVYGDAFRRNGSPLFLSQVLSANTSGLFFGPFPLELPYFAVLKKETGRMFRRTFSFVSQMKRSKRYEDTFT